MPVRFLHKGRWILARSIISSPFLPTDSAEDPEIHMGTHRAGQSLNSRIGGLNYHRDGAMRVDDNHGSTLGYEPNSYGEWQHQPDCAEPSPHRSPKLPVNHLPPEFRYEHHERTGAKFSKSSIRSSSCPSRAFPGGGAYFFYLLAGMAEPSRVARPKAVGLARSNVCARRRGCSN